MTTQQDEQHQTTEYRQSSEEISESRKHWEGVQDDEAMSYRLPEFFSLSAVFDAISSWLGRVSDVKCPKCDSTMEHDLTCPQCGYIEWKTIVSCLVVGSVCLVVPFLTWSMQNLVAKWGCGGCSLVSGLLICGIAFSLAITARKAQKSTRRRRDRSVHQDLHREGGE